jgi:hypothetical protein
LGGKIAIKYVPQIQFQLYVTERQWCDWISYSPDMPPIIVRTERDDAYIKSQASAVDEFVGKMMAKREQLAKFKQ